MSNLRTPVNFTGGYTAADLIAHFQGVFVTPAACFYTVSPIDGTVVAMTSYSSNLTSVPGYPGVTFKRNTGVIASQLQSESGNAFSQMEATMFLLAAGISEADVTAGKWVHAPATLFICNYEALNMGQLIMQSGYLAEFRQQSPALVAEIKGLNNALTAQVGSVTKATCSHTFCDAGCGLTEADYTKLAFLSSVTSQTSFTASTLAGFPADYFNNGKLTFTVGSNAGYILRIDTYNPSTGAFTIRTPAPYLPVAPTDRIRVVAGCEKRLVDCQNRLQSDGVTTANNVANRLACDFSPTIESYSRLPAGLAV